MHLNVAYYNADLNPGGHLNVHSMVFGIWYVIDPAGTRQWATSAYIPLDCRTQVRSTLAILRIIIY